MRSDSPVDEVPPAIDAQPIGERGSVTELSGTLNGIGLPPLIRFLSGLGVSGGLRITRDEWAGHLSLADGGVVAASFGSERGLGAISAIVLALPNGDFTFSAGTPAVERNVHQAPDALAEHVERLVAEHADLVASPIAPAAVPRAAAATAEPWAAERVTLDRSAVRTLLALDGQRTVAELAGEGGLVPTLQNLSALLTQRLIRIDPPNAPGALPAPPAPHAPQAVAAPAPPPPVAPWAVPETQEQVAAPAAPAAALATSATPDAAAADEEESGLRYWLRPLMLAIVALALLALTWRCSGSVG